MIQEKNILKMYFETGDKPSQTQYENLIDSLRHMHDKIPLDDLNLEGYDEEGSRENGVITRLGDFDNSNNGTKLEITDNLQEIKLSGNLVVESDDSFFHGAITTDGNINLIDDSRNISHELHFENRNYKMGIDYEDNQHLRFIDRDAITVRAYFDMSNGSAVFDNSVTASSFIGDGSQLTNITTAALPSDIAFTNTENDFSNRQLITIDQTGFASLIGTNNADDGNGGLFKAGNGSGTYLLDLRLADNSQKFRVTQSGKIESEDGATFKGVLNANGGFIAKDGAINKLETEDLGLIVKGNSASRVTLDSVAGNDSVINFNENGVQKAKLGFDSSDGLFKIISGTGPFSDNTFTLDSNGNSTQLGRAKFGGTVSFKDDNALIYRNTSNNLELRTYAGFGIDLKPSNGITSFEGNIIFNDGGDRKIFGPTNEDLIMVAKPNVSSEGFKVSVDNEASYALEVLQNNKVNITSSTDAKLQLNVSSGDSNDWNYISFNGSDGARDAYVGTGGSGEFRIGNSNTGEELTLSNFGGAGYSGDFKVLGSLETSAFTVEGDDAGINLIRTNPSLGYDPYIRLGDGTTHSQIRVDRSSNGDIYFTTQDATNEVLRVADSGDVTADNFIGNWNGVHISDTFRNNSIKAYRTGPGESVDYDLNFMNNGGLHFSYSSSSNHINAPFGGYWLVQDIMGQSNAHTQFAFNIEANTHSDNSFYYRKYNNMNTWSNWVKILNDNNFQAGTDYVSISGEETITGEKTFNDKVKVLKSHTYSGQSAAIHFETENSTSSNTVSTYLNAIHDSDDNSSFYIQTTESGALVNRFLITPGFTSYTANQHNFSGGNVHAPDFIGNWNGKTESDFIRATGSVDETITGEKTFSNNDTTFGTVGQINSITLLGNTGNELQVINNKTNDTLSFEFKSSGDFSFGGKLESEQFNLKSLNTAPSSSTDTGTTGEIRYTADYIYVCTASNTWKRTALSTW